LEAAQRGLDRLADVGRRACLRLAVAHVPAELGREHDPVAAAGEGAADDLLAAAAVAVDVRGVEEGDVRVERGVDHGSRGDLVDPPPEVVAAETDHRDLELRAAEPTRPHHGSLLE
jgi:hypothetical protein